jgi:hypothetical protein
MKLSQFRDVHKPQHATHHHHAKMGGVAVREAIERDEMIGAALVLQTTSIVMGIKSL